MNLKIKIIQILLSSFVMCGFANGQTKIGLDIDGEASEDLSGNSVSMPNRYTVAIGAVHNNNSSGNYAGHVRVYRLYANKWVQKGKDIDGEAAYDFFGSSVCMPDENILAVGARFNKGGGGNAGHVRIFRWDGKKWEQKGIDIDGINGYQSGASVSMPDSNTVAIGAPYFENGTAKGYATVYHWKDTAWIQKGGNIYGEAIDDLFGTAVSMPDSNTLAVGAPRNDGNGTNSGHVRIYKWNGNQWNQKGADIDAESAYDQSGWSVSMPDSNTVAIGAIENSGNGTYAGQVRIYTWNGNQWKQKGSDIDGDSAGNHSGFSVSMPDSNTVAIGAEASNSKGPFTRQVRVFEWKSNAWKLKGTDIDGEASDDELGRSVSMPDANTFAAGAPRNDGNGANSGHTRVYSFCPTKYSTINTTSCYSYQSPSMKYNYTNSGIYYDTIATYLGCDSIISINLTIKSNSGNSIKPIVCNSYQSPSGKYIYTQSNTYSDTLTNAIGCDSIITINLTIIQRTFDTIKITKCNPFMSPSKKYNYTSSGIYYDTIPNVAGCDSIITIYLNILKATSSNINIVQCNNYQSPSGKYKYTSSGLYKDTILNYSGCDSMITIQLTINKVDVSVTNNSPTLTAQANGATYQLLDCNNNMSTINGANNQSYTVTANGSYAVQIVQNGCTDTSVCIAINNLGFSQYLNNKKMMLYPIPTEGEFTLIFPDSKVLNSIRLYDLNGQLIQSLNPQHKNFNIAEIPAGLYLLETIDSENIRFINMIIRK